MIESKPDFFETCPDCKREIPGYHDFITWCDCGYNVNSKLKKNYESPFEKLYIKLGEKYGERLVKNIMDGYSNTIHLPRMLAYIIASIVHLSSLLCVFFAIYYFVTIEKNIITYFLSASFFLLAFVLRPRIYRLSKDEKIASRVEIPHVYALLDELCEKANVKKVYGVVINDEFNASITEIGWRRRVVIHIGLPLFTVLNHEERVAVLAHEIGHLANGDLKKGYYIHSALNTLKTWFEVLYPEDIASRDNLGVLELPAFYLLKGLSYIPYGLFYVLALFLYQESQRAEYAADSFNTSITGSHISISSLKKLYLDRKVDYIIKKLCIENNNGSFFNEIKEYINRIPKREWERMQRIDEEEKTSLNHTHPPTNFRIKVQESMGNQGPIQLKTNLYYIEDDLKRFEEQIQTKIIDKYNQSLIM